MYKINQKRLVKTFKDLAEISSPSWKEIEVIEYIEKKLKKLGLKVKRYKCKNSFNLLASLNGDKTKESILFSAHTDTVTPCNNIKVIVSDKKITSDGTTILGSDDKSAIAMFIEAIEYIKENNISHGPIEILLSCAEEIGLYGIKDFDLSNVKSKLAFIYDSDGKIGKIITKAPFHSIISITITGKAAHAGIEPEKGKSAIKVLSKILSQIPDGRIDNETTANIGKIGGGEAINIVSEHAFCITEVRSIDRKKLTKIESKIKEIVKRESKLAGVKYTFKRTLEYPGFSLKENDKIVKLTQKAMDNIKIKHKIASTGGGSDTNIINRFGIKAVNLSCGMQKVHTKSEFITIKDLVDGTKLTISLIESV